mmetsp:Transcript_43213/g.58650  ORF Transcript_43213/g.58650 Transcript_43213/m.58650 type:complete len:110 (+) Transcript_43213:103-432(+)
MRSLLDKVSNLVDDDDDSGPKDDTVDDGIDCHVRNIHYLDTILSKKCKKCLSVKPPMSHHCSTCMACVARMDHHCPWVNNCVGFYNQKFFLQFLVYVFVGSLHALILIC